MYAVAVIRYRRPLEEVLVHQDEHRAYLRELHEKGILLASGPQEPRSGGILLLRVSDEEGLAALDAVRDGDPYTRAGVAQYELIPWTPLIGAKGLEKI